MSEAKRTKRGHVAAWIVAGLGAVGALAAIIFWPRDAAAAGRGASMSVAEVQAVLRRVFAGSGIPVWFAFAVAELESGFGRVLRGDRGRSYGVFHIFWPAHESTAQSNGIATPEALDDTETCAVYWRDHVAGVFARAVGASESDPESWERVRLRLAGAGGRDGLPDNPADEARLRRYRPVAARWLAAIGE